MVADFSKIKILTSIMELISYLSVSKQLLRNEPRHPKIASLLKESVSDLAAYKKMLQSTKDDDAKFYL